MMLSLIVTLPGPLMGLKRMPVAPPCVSTIELLAMFTTDEGASAIRKAVPFVELNCARLLNTVIWLGPPVVTESAVSVPPVDKKVLFVKAIVDRAVGEKL